MGGIALLLAILFLGGGDEPDSGTEWTPGDGDGDGDGDGLPDVSIIPADFVPDSGEATLLPDVIPSQPVQPEAEPDAGDGMTDEQWLAGVDSLISDAPQQGRFFLIKQGLSVSHLAAALLGNANSGARRLALIKCLTRVPWNWDRFAADAGRGTWGTLYDVDGLNISPAWLPRNPPAVQLLAARENVPRGVDGVGGQLGAGGYYGLIWVPTFQFIGENLVCTGENQAPPDWLTSRLG